MSQTDASQTNTNSDQAKPEIEYSLFRSRGFRETALVALIPAMGYSVAYCFAIGRALQLGIPDQLISVSLPDVFRSLAAVIAPFYFLLYLFGAISDRRATALLVRLRAISSLFFLSLLFAIFLIASQAGWQWWASIFGSLAFLFVIFMVVSSIQARKGEGAFRERLREILSKQDESPRTVITRIIEQLGMGFVRFLFAIAFTLFLSFYAGMGSAANRRIFYERVGSHAVLVAVDGGSYVFESFAGNRLTGLISVVPTTTQVVLRPSHAGPLQTPRICTHTLC